MHLTLDGIHVTEVDMKGVGKWATSAHATTSVTWPGLGSHLNQARGTHEGVEVGAQRAHRTSQGWTNEVQEASFNAHCLCLGFGGHPVGWPPGRGERCLQGIASLFFCAEGYMGSAW